MTAVGVTGASGHLGGVLVRELLARGHEVRAFYRGDQRALDGLAVERVALDVSDPDSLRGAFDGLDVLYHFAALISITGGQGGAVLRTNVEGVRNVVAEARAAGVRRLVHASSIHAYDLLSRRARGGGEEGGAGDAGDADGPCIDETCGRPDPGLQGAYDCSKAAGEAVIRDAVAAGLDCVVVNPTGVIGPLDFKPSRMGRVFLALARRRMPSLVDGGFDFVDVRDIAAGAIAAAERGRTGQGYILSGSWQSVRAVAAAAEAVTGVRAPRLTTPMWLARVGAPFAELYARLARTDPLFTSESLAALRAVRNISHGKAAADLGYAPRPFAETVRDTYAWFVDAGVLDPVPAGLLASAHSDASESDTPAEASGADARRAESES